MSKGKEDTTVTVIKKFQHIFWVYTQVPNNESWKIDITPVISTRNWNFHWSEVDIVLLVITLKYHNLIYYLYFSDILCATDVLCSTRSDIDIL